MMVTVHYVASIVGLNKISGHLIFVVQQKKAFQKLNKDEQEWAKIEMLSIMRKAKNMAIQP
jgi:hypothetical protein